MVSSHKAVPSSPFLTDEGRRGRLWRASGRNPAVNQPEERGGAAFQGKLEIRFSGWMEQGIRARGGWTGWTDRGIDESE